MRGSLGKRARPGAPAPVKNRPQLRPAAADAATSGWRRERGQQRDGDDSGAPVPGGHAGAAPVRRRGSATWQRCRRRSGGAAVWPLQRRRGRVMVQRSPWLSSSVLWAEQSWDDCSEIGDAIIPMAKMAARIRALLRQAFPVGKTRWAAAPAEVGNSALVPRRLLDSYVPAFRWRCMFGSSSNRPRRRRPR